MSRLPVDLDDTHISIKGILVLFGPAFCWDQLCVEHLPRRSASAGAGCCCNISSMSARTGVVDSASMVDCIAVAPNSGVQQTGVM